MVVQAGKLIEVADYNDLAFEVNRLYSDNNTSLIFGFSDLVLNEIASPAGEPAGTTRVLSPIPNNGDYIVAIVNDITLTPVAEFTINYSSGVITYTDPLPPSAVIKVYNRETHRYGWGNRFSVYPISEGDPILADEEVLQAYLEANINNLIDKVNIMEMRTSGPTELSRVTQGAKIFASDKSTITNSINDDILSNGNYWKNDISTLTPAFHSFSRTSPWTTQLNGAARYTWTNYDFMRYFFNTGSELRAQIITTGDSSIQGFNNWNQVATQMGALIFDYSRARQTGTGGIAENIGAYDLTSTYQTIFTSTSPAAPVDSEGNFDAYGLYEDLVIRWQARLIEDDPFVGNVSVDIKAILDDSSFDQTFEGTVTFQAGFNAPDDIINNSADFSIEVAKPVSITTLDEFGADEVAASPTTEILSWSSEGPDESNVSAGFIQDTGDMNVSVDFDILGNAPTFRIDTNETIYVAGTETFNSQSALRLGGTGGPGDTSKTTITFAADLGINNWNEVENVSFRISDIDFTTTIENDYITVNAYDSANNLVTVNITPGASLTVVGNLITTNTTSSTPADASHSALISITDQIARIEITYGNNGNSTHKSYISDIHFDTIPIKPG